MRSFALVLLTLLAPVVARADAVAFIYHRFGEGGYPTTNVTLEQFDAHLDHLARAGFQVWPLDKVVATLQEGAALPPRVVSITIDDGFASIYTGAYPRLKARKLPFTVFLNTDALDKGLAGHLTWAQVKEMAANGARFANHTATHDKVWKRRAGESEAQWAARIRADVGRCQQRLQAELGPATNEEPRLFAYPYGEFDAASSALIAQMRYVAFGQHSGAVAAERAALDAPALPRFPMSERFASVEEFAQKARARALPASVVAPTDPLIARDGGRGNANPPVLRLRFADAAWRGRIACYYSSERLDGAWSADGRELSTRAPVVLEPGRHRYNCTGRDPKGEWFWFSQPWVVE
jgi:peptidoglycan/xylan/chitin deacetylase (PgdA/CDA1 family)